MSARTHVIVLGLGIAGSSIAATLAERKFRVTAIEQFSPLHERGSSHGDTRIFRRIPHEGEVYADLAATSYRAWKLWNEAASEAPFLECGGIDAGPETSSMVSAAETLCKLYGESHQVYSGSSFNKTCSAFKLPENWRVIYQPHSGIVRPDTTRAFLQDRARAAGARLIHNIGVQDFDCSEKGITVRTKAETLTADLLVVAAGAWTAKLLPALALPLSVERRVLAWFEQTQARNCGAASLPVFVLDADGGWYGMSTPTGQVKIGHDKHRHESVDPNCLPIAAKDEDIALLSRCVQRYLRGFAESPSATKPCLYTLTEDRHFLIDWHPHHRRVLLFTCCSGHGFKYAPVYGDIVADLIDGKSNDRIAAFRLERSTKAATRFGI